MRLRRDGIVLSLCLALLTALALTACGGDDGGGTDDGDGSVNDGDGGVNDGDGGIDAPITPPGDCITGTSQCSDGVDNDNDTTIDLADPECTTACDNDESSFATGQPGDNRDPNWQDCFFDGNSGGGDDRCRYNTCCLYPSGSPNECSQQQLSSGACDVADDCVANCAPAVPPGCDCFGCCTVCGVTGGCGDINGCVRIVLLPTCNFENICTDTVNCPICQQDDECTTQCPTGTTECGVDSDCLNGQFCTDGCCVAQIP